MSGNELAALSRAHELFAGRTRSVAVDARLAPYDGLAGTRRGAEYRARDKAVTSQR